jgi:hypothetical protein
MDDKGLYISAKIVDNDAWKKVEEGVYKAFSIGGRVLKRDDADDTIIKEMELTEISLVDRPANPEAMIDLVKSADSTIHITAMDGKAVNKLFSHTASTDEFVHPAIPVDAQKIEKAKANAGSDEPEVVEIEPGIVAEVKEAKQEPVEPVNEVAAEVVEPVVEQAAQAVVAPGGCVIGRADDQTDIKKGMWCVSNLAQMLAQIECVVGDAQWEEMIEGDDSPVVTSLAAWLQAGKELLVEYVTEEVSESADGDVDVIVLSAVAEIFKHYGVDPEKLDENTANAVLTTLDLVSKVDSKDFQAIHDVAHKHGAKCEVKDAPTFMKAFKPGELAKANAKVDVLEKTVVERDSKIEALNKTIETLKAQPVAKQPHLRIVSKGEDFMEEVEKTEEVDTDPMIAAKNAIKKAYKTPLAR